MKRSHGSYSKNSRNLAGKGRRTIRQRLSSFKDGDHVRIAASPSTKDGRPFLRFNGVTGKIVGRQGAVYKVELTQGRATRTILVSNAHLEIAV
ncbi:hypothetical protein AUJ14_00940 [Candidatus Micrarchaeota archaeon CG1_02_55_22]|nr:MAG: hypothetical protein AUJ14_00940 [Candidatus Micrarchaeota archaeon CG1_02_55_22]